MRPESNMTRELLPLWTAGCLVLIAVVSKTFSDSSRSFTSAAASQ